MTAFFPTDVFHSACSAIHDSVPVSSVDHRLGGPHRFGGLRQLRALGVGERDLEDLLEAVAPQLARDTAEHVLEPELALEPGRARQNPPLVERDGLHHLHGRRAWRVVRRARLEEGHDLGPAVSRPVHDLASLSAAISWLTGIPETVVYETSGTIVSPCPPSTMAWMSSTETSIASARNVRYRAVSSTPAMPRTRSRGKPLAFIAT